MAVRPCTAGHLRIFQGGLL